MTKANVFFIILAVLWMGVIFYPSSKTQEESEAYSDNIEMAIGQVTVDGFENQTTDEQAIYVRDNRVFIRKAAHVLEFTILCVLLFLGLSGRLKIWLRLLISGGGAILYAISDEVHQYFVPGRSGLVSDVLIDSIGVGIAVGVLTVIFLIKWKLKTAKQLKNS